MNLESLQRAPALRSYLECREEILALYLFGSQGEGVARPDSDVDVAVLLNPAVDRERHSQYRLQFLSEIQRFVKGTLDLLILNQIPPLLQFQVLQRGRLIFDPDPDERAAIEMTMLNRYYQTKRFYDFHFDRLMRHIKEKGLGRGSRSQRHTSSSEEAGRISTKLAALSDPPAG